MIKARRGVDHMMLRAVDGGIATVDGRVTTWREPQSRGEGGVRTTTTEEARRRCSCVVIVGGRTATTCQHTVTIDGKSYTVEVEAKKFIMYLVILIFLV